MVDPRIPIYHHPWHIATNCGKQTVALYLHFSVLPVIIVCSGDCAVQQDASAHNCVDFAFLSLFYVVWSLEQMTPFT
jgi:hypothetical protein